MHNWAKDVETEAGSTVTIAAASPSTNVILRNIIIFLVSEPEVAAETIPLGSRERKGKIGQPENGPQTVGVKITGGHRFDSVASGDSVASPERPQPIRQTTQSSSGSDRCRGCFVDVANSATETIADPVH